MHAAEGILTTRGGMTSHAAVVARGMGKPCVTGAGALRVDYRAQTMSAGDTTLKKGDTLTIDGSTGQVLVGKVAMREPELTGEFGTLMNGPMRCASSRCAPMPTRPPTRAPPSGSAPRASGSAAPSTCSSTRTASGSCVR